MPPSFGASALPGFAPPPPAWRTAPRSLRKAILRPSGDHRGVVSLLLPDGQLPRRSAPSAGASHSELR